MKRLALISLMSIQSMLTTSAMTSDTENTSAKVSDLVTLSCKSSSPWFFCVWEGPKGDRVCALRAGVDKGQTGGICGSDDRLRISGKLGMR